MPRNELIIYEGAMCCSTGVCGPEPDQELIALNETIKKLQGEYNGQLNIIRASLAFNSLMFFTNKEVFQMVKDNGAGNIAHYSHQRRDRRQAEISEVRRNKETPGGEDCT